jgi:FkbM family methyltransferase
MSFLKELMWYQILTKLPEMPVSVQTKFGKFKVSNKDQVIGRELFIKGEFDFEKMQKALELLNLKGQGVLLDIGANIGTVCIPLLKNNHFSKAIAIEPEPKNFSLLKKNIHQNGLDSRIAAHQLALSDREGELHLGLSDSNFGDHRILVDATGAKSVTVKSLPLDQIITDENVDLIWIDVQGYEKFVLQGARRVLSKNIPVVMEFWPFGLKKTKTDKNEFYEVLKSHFKFFYDLNEKNPQKKEISEFLKLYDKYPDPQFTDLVLISG